MFRVNGRQLGDGGVPRSHANNRTEGPIQSRHVRVRFSRGLKLDHALVTFGIDVTGKICADLGCNAGGFVDCLLQRGAAKVYAIDTGYGRWNGSCAKIRASW